MADRRNGVVCVRVSIQGLLILYRRLQEHTSPTKYNKPGFASLASGTETERIRLFPCQWEIFLNMS